MADVKEKEIENYLRDYNLPAKEELSKPLTIGIEFEDKEDNLE